LPDAGRLATLIGTTTLFRTLAEPDLQLLGQHARLTVEPANRVVVQAGEAGTVLYLVLEGLLSAEGTRRTAGLPVLPTMLRPGDLFDAPVVLLGEAHVSTVRTRTPALLCELSSETLQRLFTTAPQALPQVAQALAEHYAPKGNTRPEDDRTNDILRQMRHLFPASPGTGQRRPGR
jgi:CRP-like cAMP-binding protein